MLHGARVEPGVVNAGTYGGGRGIEVAHLLGHVAQVAAELCQLHGNLHRRPGVAAHEVGDNILLLARLTRKLFKLTAKALINAVGRLAHHTQDLVAHVLWGKSQLTGGVMLGKLTNKGVVAVEQGVVKADSAAYKDLLHARKCAQLTQELDVALVRHRKVLAGLRREATPAHARPARELLLAGGHAEVCRGAAHVVNVALKVGVVGHGLCLGEQALVAATLDDAPLVKVERAEGAFAKASTVARKTELDFGDGRNATSRLVAGVICPCVGQLVDGVKLLGRERSRGWILNDIYPVRILLHERPSEEGVELAILQAKAASVFALVRLHLLVGGQNHRAVALLVAAGPIHRTWDKAQILHRKPRVERFGYLDDGVLAHAIANDVSAGVEQD